MAFPPTSAPQPQTPPCLLDSQASSIPCRSFAVSNLSLPSHTSLKVGQPASMRNLGSITEHVEESVCCKHHLTKQQSVQMQQPLPVYFPDECQVCCLVHVSLQAGLMTHLCTGITPWQLQSSMPYKSCCQKTSVISASLAWTTTTCCLSLMWTNCSQQISAA